MAKKHVEKIKQTASELLNKAGVRHTLLAEEVGGVVKINIDSEDSALLIGYRGETLSSLEHIIKLISQKEIYDDEFPKLVLDIGGYRSEQDARLKEMVESLAERVLESKQPEVMRPMNAYERRIAHIALRDNDTLIAESVGEEPNRRIIIKIKDK